jgi:hypothetical protein
MNRFTCAALVLTFLGVLSCSPQSGTTRAEMYLEPAHDMETASSCANLLKLLEGGKSDQAKRLAEWRMSPAVKAADRATLDGFEPDVAAPHLEEGIRRAADCARRYPLDPDVAAAAEGVLNRWDGP